MAHTKHDAAKEAFWRDVFRRQARSGLSVRQFCRQHQLSEPSFYERRRTYRQQDEQRATARAAGDAAARPAFVPLIVRDAPPARPEMAPEMSLVIDRVRSAKHVDSPVRFS